MKFLVILIALFLATGCATKSDLKQLNERLTQVEVSEACHGKYLELRILVDQVNNAPAPADPLEAMRIELGLKAMQAEATAACKKYDEMEKASAK